MNNMWINQIPGQGKRVLMLTPDVMIDRRILIEAETLIDDGYEVYLLAGWDGKSEDLFEIEGRVKVERIKYEGIDQRFTFLYKSQNYLISLLNQISSGVDVTANKISLGLNNIDGLLIPWISKLIYIVFFKPVLLFINISLRIKDFFITATAKLINLSVKSTVTIYPIFTDSNGYEYLFFKRGLFYRPDIIHVHDLPMLKAGVKLKKALNIPLIYDMHEFYPEQPRLSEKQRKSLQTIEKKYIKDTNSVITVNPMLGNIIKDTYNLKEIYTIQNSVCNRNLDINKRFDRFREDYPHLKDKFLLLYQGWIASERNLETAIQAMSLVKNNQWTLLIMGYGDYQVELEQLALDQGVLAKIQFVPSKSQDVLLDYTASADIGLIPYPTNKDINTHYVSPNKLYEFIAARLPIICNNLPFVKSVVETNGFGLACEMDSPESFADALNNFPLDKLEEFKTNLTKKGANFLWEVEAPKLLEIYKKL